ncbi:LytR/AlgR family response regulator transcription factor [Asaccharospora irregularis]|uniref:Stage 0 sporulation protein A homolog n=1 Tax=Asaccharospora irregularis DSM 2635 TaxID=1121321 RepID=A0A1M5LM43_9FIRM|nr:LytTR family DNA-binding domain-containing protein [Asaccharospora irregularis]SHG66026.1 DNA-binding response regulator, LytR/AlgR family [Asaccharospora irregularis DSM 2635]
MLLHIGICEDDLLQREFLVNSVKKFLKLKDISFNIYEFSSGEELLEKYPETLDILFLDIQMDKLTGMEASRQIRKFDNKVEILFITAVSEYVQKGYEVRAYRYLLKPISYETLSEHLDSCVSGIISKIENVLFVDNKGYMIKLDLNSILYIETDKREITIYEENKSYNLKIGINDIEKQLKNKRFFRCHNSFLINITKIQSLIKNVAYIDDIQIPVSKYRVKDLKRELASYLGEVIC